MIVCLIATWRDGEQLAAAVASASPHVERVVVLDGVYAGVNVEHGPAWSDGGELVDAVNAGVGNVVVVVAPWPAGTTWPDEIAKRNALLELGRAFCPSARWALVLDADEQLVHGEQLRELVEYVEHWRPSLAAVPLARVEPSGDVWGAPSRLFRLGPFTRYVGNSYTLARGDFALHYGETVDLSHARELVDDALGQAFPVHVAHRWDLRSPARQRARVEWGRTLARLDHGDANGAKSAD